MFKLLKTGNIRAWARALRIVAVCALSVCLAGALFVPAAHAAGTGKVTLTVKQVFDGADLAGADGTFSYRLIPGAASNPMPAEGGVFTAAGNAEKKVGPIAFETAGVYVYEIACATAAKSGYTYDGRTYTVQIFVSGDLQTSLVIYGKDGSKTTEIAFRHTYAPVQGPPTPPDPPTPPAPDPPPAVTPVTPPAPDPEEPEPAEPETATGAGVSEPADREESETDFEYDFPDEEDETPTIAGFGEKDLAKLEAQTGNVFSDLAAGNVPMGNFFASGVWSLLSLILVLLSLVVSTVTVLFALLGRRTKDDVRGSVKRGRKTALVLRTLPIFLGPLIFLFWLAFDDISQPMAWINNRTSVIAALYLAQVAFCLLHGRVGRRAILEHAAVE
jgi:pilin isopeptide linkage protein